ncbi:hypothetical protein RclHR1_08120004 [Rhizophagus clarus]|uniref:HMG domain containing protein n=1 Tax=Rhizophagus clarus TaxID=94130 RepID=A0A2Z6S6F6_9GLOM|nr:hypothetical protein RclHR1_08120004 [Rhizophagus clarus]GES78766.1 HMG domain containing protein [Rhizophagus clarus]
MSKNSQHEQQVVPPNIIALVYNPRFALIDLISTRKRPFTGSTRNPPRPPNSFFLMKNCLLLELRLGGYRLTMPSLCKMARGLWHDIPQEVKNTYDSLAVQAQILHQRAYPNYKFAPQKRNRFKPFVPPNNEGMSAFSSVGAPVTSLEPSISPTSCSSCPSPIQPSEEVYLPNLPINTPEVHYIYNEIGIDVINNNNLNNISYYDYVYYPMPMPNPY